MTATSKRLASTVQSRGYYTSASKGKGKGKGGGIHHSKDKGNGKKGITSSSSTSGGKGKGLSTGCQRQVAGKRWHAAHAQRVGLPRLSFKEKTMFRFGPHDGSSSNERFAYPAGLGGSFAVMFFSCVDEDAPALMSRQCLVDLDALPDISKGKMHYRALGATTNLYLSSCGHLAVRLDEWPAQMPPWPFSMPLNHKDLPDVWSPGARELCSSAPSS